MCTEEFAFIHATGSIGTLRGALGVSQKKIVKDPSR